jgi:short-subunit dehydrogenase
MQRIVITGATGGLGMALASLLDSQNNELVLVGRDEIALRALNESLGSKHQILVVDLASSTDLDRLAEQLLKQKIDVLINNAGLNEFGEFADLAPAMIEQMFQVNVIAPMRLTQALLPSLLRDKATILNVGSVFGYIGFPFYATYSATKFALRGFTEALFREYKDQGLNVLFVAPRAIATSMNDARTEAMNKELGNTADSPEAVALQIVQALHQSQTRKVIGFPEKLFARINGVLPTIVDKALLKQVATMRRFAKK